MEKAEIKELINLARLSIEKRLEGKKVEVKEEIKRKYSEEKGVFITLLTYPEERLRGCIGFPRPVYPLWRAVIVAAREAAFTDPRFSPLSREEYKNIIVEISILTQPKLLEVKDPREYLEAIKIGRDGLIVEFGPFSGLLLPQVPLEEGWNVERFLDYCCLKAGLPPRSWLDRRVKVYTFQAEVWKEKEPKGEVIRVL